jgi:hypothetical protein
MRRDSLLSHPGSCPADGVQLTFSHSAGDQTASGLSRMLTWITILLENVSSISPGERRFRRLRLALRPRGASGGTLS